jgi:hypothetical protein
MILTGDKQLLGENLSQLHFLHNKFYTVSPGIGSWPLQGEAGEYLEITYHRLNQGVTLLLLTSTVLVSVPGQLMRVLGWRKVALRQALL